MKNGKRRNGILVIFILIIFGIISYKAIGAIIDNSRKTSFRKCINIGNALEAPKNISWDVTMKAEYFDIIKNAGFDSVRLPVRFSDYVNEKTYILDEEFMKEIDYILSKLGSSEFIPQLTTYHLSLEIILNILLK